MTKNSTVAIPKRAILLARLIAFMGFSYVQFLWIIRELGEFYTIPFEELTFVDIGTLWYPIVGYFLISCNILFVVSVFKKLKPFEEKGLSRGLIWGLSRGLIWGLIWGFVMSLTKGLLIAGLIWGFVAGLILGLVWGLVWGLASGLTKEFSK